LYGTTIPTLRGDKSNQHNINKKDLKFIDKKKPKIYYLTWFLFNIWTMWQLF